MSLLYAYRICISVGTRWSILMSPSATPALHGRLLLTIAAPSVVFCLKCHQHLSLILVILYLPFPFPWPKDNVVSCYSFIVSCSLHLWPLLSDVLYRLVLSIGL